MKLQIAALALVLGLPLVSRAQIIPIKTVPVATGNQFQIFPSRNLAMGEASLAVDDELLDPFVNPANAVRLEGLHVVSAAMPVADPLSRSPSGCYFDHTLCSEGCIGHNKNSQLKHSQR